MVEVAVPEVCNRWTVRAATVARIVQALPHEMLPVVAAVPAVGTVLTG